MREIIPAAFWAIVLVGVIIGASAISQRMSAKREPITEQNAVVTNGERTTYRFTDVEREALRTNVFQVAANTNKEPYWATNEKWNALSIRVDPRVTYTFASSTYEPELTITCRSHDGTPWSDIKSPTNVTLWIFGEYVPKLGKSNDQWVITFEKP